MVKKLIGVVVVLAVVVVGFGVWYFVLSDDEVEKNVVGCDPEPCEESTVESVDGSWAIDSATSTGTIVVTETIGGVADHEAAGDLGDLTGTVEVSGSQVTAVELTVDMTGLTFTDAPTAGSADARSSAMENQGLETNDFPEATFSLTSPIELGDDLTSGEIVTAEATGDLTIHGVTNPITFDVDVVADGATFQVTPSEFIPVVIADYDISLSAPPFVADISDEGTFDFELVLTQA